MIFRRQFPIGAFFAPSTSQICRVAAGETIDFVASLANIACLTEILSVTVLFFPWHDHC
jgi:hypothetical protein